MTDDSSAPASNACQASTGRYAFAPKDPAAPMVPLPPLSHICAFPTSNDNKEYEDCSLYTAFLRISGSPARATVTSVSGCKRHGWDASDQRPVPGMCYEPRLELEGTQIWR
ncbi:g13330 [Coccomyxa viridis]|uniref:G13330 protein n=1 Tax=Coccomyxa viridis TaxID=1274662 RepID=A0ABP1GGU8_9CHLO